MADDPVDPALVGTWTTTIKNEHGEWTLTFRLEASGAYRTTSQGTTALPEETGKFLAANYDGVEGAQPLYVEPFGQLDLSVGYNFNKHLRFQFEAINLTDEYTRTHMRNENQVGAVTQLGRRIMIGARYKF